MVTSFSTNSGASKDGELWNGLGFHYREAHQYQKAVYAFAQAAAAGVKGAGDSLWDLRSYVSKDDALVQASLGEYHEQLEARSRAREAEKSEAEFNVAHPEFGRLAALRDQANRLEATAYRYDNQADEWQAGLRGTGPNWTQQHADEMVGHLRDQARHYRELSGQAKSEADSLQSQMQNEQH